MPDAHAVPNSPSHDNESGLENAREERCECQGPNNSEQAIKLPEETYLGCLMTDDECSFDRSPITPVLTPL